MRRLRLIWPAVVMSAILVAACGTPTGVAFERAWLGGGEIEANSDGDTECGAQECGLGELSPAICDWVTMPLQPGELLPRQLEVPCLPGELP